MAENLKTLSEPERDFVKANQDMIKNAVISAVANDGAGVCYDAYALCQKRIKVEISENIPVYIWHGTADTTVPISFTEYFKSEYNIKELHKIENLGHMLYLPYWNDIIKEISRI